MSATIYALQFYARNARFNFAEQFTQIANGFVSLLFLPMFMFVLSHMWSYFNSYLGNFTYEGMLAYVGVTEILFMTFIRAAIIQRTAGDFSLSLARPRSWLALQFSACVGRVSGTRLLMCGVYAITLLSFGVPSSTVQSILGRLLIVLVPMAVIQALYHLLLLCAAVRWEFISHITLPFSKIFLIFGGVFAPLSDFSETAKKIVLLLPPSDIFFQPAYFCVHGFFYGISALTWIVRVSVQAAILFGLCHIFFRWAKRHHQSYGG